MQHTRLSESSGRTGKPVASRAELYEQAKHAGVSGRSRMSKAELGQALRIKRH